MADRIRLLASIALIVLGSQAVCIADGQQMGTQPPRHANTGSAGTLRPDQPRIPATLFGMHIMGRDVPLPIPFGAQAKSTGTAWPYIEPERGVFDWSKEDAAVATAEAQRVAPPFYSTNGIPSWATTNPATCKPNFRGGAPLCPAMVANIADWDKFISAFVGRYKGRMIYELWNEPNTKYFSGTVHDMVTLANHEHDIIRRLDPGAIIIAPSGGAAYLNRFFAEGGTRDVDVVPFHEYDVTPEDVISTIDAMRAVMRKYGLAAKPLWDTEGGWWDTGGLWPYRGQIEDYPGYVARRYLIEWSFGTRRLYWYAWNNKRFGTLTNGRNIPNAAGIAYGQTFRWMVGATMSTPCARRGIVWSCGLTRRGGYQALAVWTIGGAASFAPPPIYRQYRELDGKITSFTPGMPVTVGPRPVLFENETAARYGGNRDFGEQKR